MEQEIEAFRAYVAGLGREWRGTRYPADVRVWALRLAEELRGAGLGRYAVGRRLGIRAETLASWSEPDTEAFAPVIVESPARTSAAPTAGLSERLVLTSPGGWRIEGLGVAELEQLVRFLQ